jgi:hypothetical protein
MEISSPWTAKHPAARWATPPDRPVARSDPKTECKSGGERDPAKRTRARHPRTARLLAALIPGRVDRSVSSADVRVQEHIDGASGLISIRGLVSGFESEASRALERAGSIARVLNRCSIFTTTPGLPGVEA